MESQEFIGLPLCSRKKNSGMARAVGVLREAGIADSLRTRTSAFVDYGDVAFPEIHTDSGRDTLVNFSYFLRASERIRSAFGEVNARGLMFCLGGECSICVGTLAGLESRVKGRPGIVWIDAHGDFNTPETTASGYIGGMCLAMACGRGPELKGIVHGGKSLISEENVVHLASRALDPSEAKAIASSSMRVYSASAIRDKGIRPTVDSLVSSLANRCDWIMCHLDVDAIDPRIMPAVNFPEPDGLTFDEAKAVVGAVQETGKLKLFELAGYNSDLDENRTCAVKLVTFVSDMMVH